ncbi:hypothetical protein K474DRAFT_410701 [Panus rudis PR-1116 ss-1]|nr:hypothetical protein K474DRAFT_410701 [Panus rudis PR-1116 ss-1]
MVNTKDAECRRTLSFDTARTKLDHDLGQDLELLVAVFEESTRPDFNASPTFWLTRCQETDVMQASLERFPRMDLVGFSDLSLLRARKQPLYAPHILTFHTALASVPSAAERAKACYLPPKRTVRCWLSLRV